MPVFDQPLPSREVKAQGENRGFGGRGDSEGKIRNLRERWKENLYILTF